MENGRLIFDKSVTGTAAVFMCTFLCDNEVESTDNPVNAATFSNCLPSILGEKEYY